MNDQHKDDRRRAHKVRALRRTLICLSLLNTILIPCSRGSLFYGLIPTEISLGVNAMILFFPRSLGQPIFMLISDTIFALGFCTWFIFANLLMSGSGYSSGVVAGTWSSVVTLMMLIISAILVIKTAKQIKKSRTRSQIKCKHCPHCRANDQSLTPSDHTSTPSSPQSTGITASGLRQIVAGYVPVATGEHSPPYRDEEAQEDGKIALGDDEATKSRDRQQGF